MALKDWYKNARIVILVVSLLLSLFLISPHPWNEGAAIRSVAKESAALAAGIAPPEPNIAPVLRERILKVNNQESKNAEDYFIAINEIMERGINISFTIETNKNLYGLVTEGAYETITLDETEWVNVTTLEFDESLNESVNVTRLEEQNKTSQKFLGVEDVGLAVYDAPTTNIRKGLDLSGGTRVILEPQSETGESIAVEDIELVTANIKERLNVFGLSDIIVRSAQDLNGKDFIIVEIAGAEKDDVRELLSNQGKFDAFIGNETVFRGGDKDITYVCRSAECSGIDPRAGCGIGTDGIWSCRFRFSISLSPAAAARQASLTENVNVIFDTQGSYLEDPLELYLDGEFIDSLQIAADLKGRALTDIEISGSGAGGSQQEAINDALINMKKLQTVMITGSLPLKLEIVKTDAISPLLGKEFVKNAIFIGFLAVLAVVSFVFFVYREWRVSIPMSVTMISEAVIILGFASLVGWNLDLAAIAAIIIAIGTGVDHQIVIADEALRGDEGVSRSWKERAKRAFFIITAAYVTTSAAMIPLWFAGAGMLRGFAITTIIGVSIGVFITRPAFAVMLKLLLKEEE